MQRCAVFPSILRTRFPLRFLLINRPILTNLSFKAQFYFLFQHGVLFPFTLAVSRCNYSISVFLCTSLKSSSLLCCFLRSIFFTATCLPLCFSLAMHTIPVEPSPILMKLSRYSRGSPADRSRGGSALKERYKHDIKFMINNNEVMIPYLG